METNLLSKLEKLFNTYPFMRAETVSTEKLLEAEKVLGVKFTPEYKNFVAKYGGAIVGPFPIYGLARAEPMDQELWSVINVTLRYRTEGWPDLNESYVISSDHSDNPIMVRKNGEIVGYDHDFCEFFDVAPSFNEYLLQCLNQ